MHHDTDDDYKIFGAGLPKLFNSFATLFETLVQFDTALETCKSSKADQRCIFKFFKNSQQFVV